MPQGAHCAWPATAAKKLAAQLAHTVLLVAEQALAVAEPGAHTVQLEQGDWPLALQVEPAAQFATVRHESVGESQ